MSDFTVKSDAVDVEQIMRQIRARIREKRGADYTEAELQQLASVKLEKFLDPRGLRSDLVQQFRKHRIVSEAPPTYEFGELTLYQSHRMPLLYRLRRLLNPILKLFFNPDPLTQALHIQTKVNAEYHRRFREREELDPLYFEVIHNLVLEMTRLGIETNNLKMRLESLSSRLDFDERRARSLESVVQYRKPRQEREDRQGRGDRPDRADRQERADRPDRGERQDRRRDEQERGAGAPAAAGASAETEPAADAAVPDASAGTADRPQGQGEPGAEGQTGERRRRRRRRRRKPGQTAADRGPAGQRPPHEIAPEDAALGGVREEGSPSYVESPADEDYPDTDDDVPGSGENDDVPGPAEGPRYEDAGETHSTTEREVGIDPSADDPDRAREQ